MSKSVNKKIKAVNIADIVVSCIVVAFLFVFAFSAMVTHYLSDGDDAPTPTQSDPAPTEEKITQSYGEYPRLYAAEVKAASEKYGIEEERIYAVIRVESNFKADCVSRVGARGLMQMLPSTYKGVCERLGRQYNADDLFDPAINIDICTYYLKYVYDMFDDWDHAHAAYNAGHYRVKTWLKDERYSKDGKLIVEKIPYKETKNYVNKVNYYYNEYKLEKANNK